MASLAAFTLILVGDLLLVVLRPHEPSMKESGLWVSAYCGLALLFALVLFFITDATYTGQFLAGWITEYSLSVDNLFVFTIIIGSQFLVPRRYQQRVIVVGVVVAIIFRGIFILIGAALIASFSWIFYLFGAILVWAAYKQLIPGKAHATPAVSNTDGDSADGGSAVIPDSGRITRLLRHRLRISDTYDGGKLRTGPPGSRRFTPMLLVFLAVGITDVIFAFDSIPAIFGITSDPFLVFATNFFALMGLRQLYFLLAGSMKYLEYLKYGIAVILGFIGVKLVLHAIHDNTLPFINGGQPLTAVPEIGTWESLAFIIVVLGLSVILSLLKGKKPVSQKQDRRK